LLSSISGTRYLCRHPVRFSSIVSHGLNHRFLVPLHPMFRFTLCIYRPILYCYQWSLRLSVFLTASWIITCPNGSWNYTSLIVQNFGKVEMSISRFLRRKSQLSF
jgi:hypothetical protein